MAVSGALRAKYLLPWCCIHDSLKFDMQNDHVLKKSSFDVLTPLPKSAQGVGHRSSIINHVLICFLFIVTLSACVIFVKILTSD